MTTTTILPRHALPVLLCLCLAACRGPAETPEAPPAARAPAAVEPAVATEPPGPGSVVDVAFWEDPAVPGGGVILAAAGLSGVVLHAPDGRRLGALDEAVAGGVAVLPAGPADPQPLVVVYDRADSALEFYRLSHSPPALTPVPGEAVVVEDEVIGLCHHRSPVSGADYVYAVTDGGLVLHFQLDRGTDHAAAWQLRTIPVGKGAGFCDVDPVAGALYVSEESVGIWRIGAEAESDPGREPVALAAPWGELSDEVKGVAVYRAGETVLLVAADVGEERLAVIDADSGRVLGHAAVTGLAEAEGLTAIESFGPWPTGVLAIADEDAPEGSNVKLLAWDTLAGALALPVATSRPEPPPPVPAVRPVLETEVAASYGDAADDPAIWVHPEDPEQSLVIGTDKQLGLYVFDLEGRTLQMLPDGRMNNVDVRDGFRLGGEEVTLVAASNRSTDSIALYRLDPETRRLSDVAAGVLPTGFNDPYGLCLYSSGVSGELFVFVNESDDGTFRQWRLVDAGNGRVGIELVREFSVGSQAEGCVADDETGALYVNEEDVGLWKYSAEPDGGDARTLIDGTEDGHLTADVEGVALWKAPDGGGYIVVSNQGADNYVLYERRPDHAYVGTFHVVADPASGVDGASETDGLDVTSAPLGPRFPKGLLVVQDGRNIGPEERQNFKFVSWADVAEALDLP